HGRKVTHTYAGGRFTASLTTAAGTRRLPPLTSVSLSLVAPGKADYGATVRLRAVVKPKLPVRRGGRLFRHGKLTMTVTGPALTVAGGPAGVRRTLGGKPQL